MAQKTDLNVSPYFDDFSETDNFITAVMDEIDVRKEDNSVSE